MPRLLKFWRQYIATLLIFILLISQTIRVDFFSRVEASQETYRDIVSIFVDTDTYEENRAKITRYAEDIQTYLGSTRASVFVMDSDISPAVIATQNEKLYYEGDGEEDTVSRLVGTILIGDLPIPMVDSGKDQFPSVYPYVDFVDKKFLYNQESGTYIVAENDNQKIVEPEIWHGVINPAVGRPFELESIEADPTLSGSVDIISDITKIDTFLDKTHDFYTQSGVFAPTTMPPRVFYYDGFLEAKSFAIEDLGAYKVYMDSAEEVIYNRFSKYFLKYVIGKVEEEKRKFNQEELAYIDSLGIEGTDSTMFPDGEVDKTPDIHTKPMIMELLKKFYQLINAKSLGDIRGFVHNAGRYNDGTDVRLDQPAINITLMDYSAMNALRKINDKLENWVDTVEIVNPFSTFIMDYLTIKEPFTPEGQGITRHYDNFLFGRKGSTIFDPQFCTISRGSGYTQGPYKQGIHVEANAAFDVYTTPESMELYEKDGEKRIDCGLDDNNPDTYLTDSYWGGNIITNVDTSNWTFKEPSNTQDFYIPIFSLSGMKDITQPGAEVLHVGPPITEANPKDCNAAYSPYPYMLQSGAIREDGPWPNDDGRSINDISCKTVPELWTQPTWGGEGDPNTRLLGMEWESHYLVGGEGQCANGMVAISIIGSSVPPTVPPYLWACLPPEVVCPEMPEMGKTHYQCIAPLITGYVTSLIPMESEAPPLFEAECDGTPGKLFAAPCPYNAGNNQERYPEKLPDGAAYMSPCMVGMFIFNAAIAPDKNLNYPCINLAMAVGSGATTDENGNVTSNQNNQNVSEESAIYTIQAITDHTTYETQSFHSIFDSRLFHKSPTDEEIAAAEASNITPSIAIDHDRHVIFMEESPANIDKTIVYANMFRFDEEEIIERHRTRIAVNLTDAKGQARLEKYGSGAIVITAYRLELDRLGKEQWEGSLPSTEPKFFPPAPSCWGGQLVDSPACMPATVDGPLSDDDIVAAIQANRWLNPDVTVKMRKAVETGLSYSREYGSGGVTDIETITAALANPLNFPMTITGTLSSPPEILTLSGGYEIAYLGLTDFIPDADDNPNNIDTLDGGMSDTTLAAYSEASEAYTQGMQQLAAINISEEDAEDAVGITPAPSDSCGPPEGVDLFEWPAAIQCWISSLTPVRIIGQACGVNTIGLDAALLSNSVFMGGAAVFHGASVTPPPSSDTAATSATLATFYSGARLTYHLSRDVMLPGESIEARFFYARDNALMGVPDSSNITLDVLSIRDKAGQNIDITEANRYIDITPNSTRFAEDGSTFLVQSEDAIGTVTLRATLTLPALDGSTMISQSDIITVRIADEYLLAVPTLDGRVTSQIPVTSSTGFSWEFDVKNLTGTSLAPRYPITLDIYDDVSGGTAYTGIVITQSGYTLPPTYTRNVGVYRLEFRDAAGRHATNTIAVNAGSIAMASFSPVSSALLRGSNTVVTLRLRDALGNPVSPDLYSIDLTAQGGYFILENGEKKTTMHIDAIESEIPLTIGSDVAGTIQLTAQVEETIETNIDLRVFETARVILSRTGTPEVGGPDIPVTVRVEDAEGRPLEGFRSVLNLTIGAGGGAFTPEIVMIDNGISEPLTYTPGRLAGEHRVTASIPGLGSVPDIPFTVSPGIPMYITHIEDDTYITFSLRDRYNNIAPVTLSGTLETGGNPVENIVFSGGVYARVKDAGYMFLDVPGLSQSQISFTDENGTYTMRGIPKYTAWIKALTQRFNFLEDYNARYTVLAGGSFLRESEDILYNTTPGSGQSLAVTTLLDTPFKRDTLFSLFPGGGFLLGDIDNALPEPYLSLEGGYPILTVRDAVTNSLVTQARYRTIDPRLDICSGDDCLNSLDTRAHIRLESTQTGIVARTQGDELVLMKDATTLVTIMENGMIYHAPGVILRVHDKKSQKALFIDVVSGIETLGHIIYKTDSDTSIEYQRDTALFTGSTIYLDDVGDYLREKTSQHQLADTITGYRYQKRSNTPTYDTEKNGPESIDGFGLTIDTPGIGWKGTNRTLLSYAGGDTVGEATKWFHTYTLINLGDPVAHNDKKAPGTELDGIDRSIGTQLTSPQASPVRAYTQRDMDNDGYEDIVVLHSNGYVELLLNLGDRIRSRGNIAYIPDMTERGFSIGDFQKDGYADIVGVDTEGNFVILANNERQFTRMRITVATGATLPTGVTQFKVRDMDNDTRDDIVYLTEGGELSILYGTTTQGYFEKVVLDATLGLTLSDTAIKTGGALYATRIPQVALDALPGSGGLDESLIWNEVYAPYRYTPVQPAVDVDISEPEDFSVFASIYGSGTASPEASQASRVKNFVRSEYADAFDIDISKKYSLGSGSVLRSGERITVDITIRNTGNTALTGVEYLDTIPAIFSPENTIRYRVNNGNNSTTGDFVLTSSSDYDTYFTLPDIAAGQSIVLSYELDALPTSYGELLVGDYEQGETGADVYGDVGFSTATTCGADMLLWRSGPAVPEIVPTPPALIPRTYMKGTRSFADMVIPPEIAAKIQDANGDGIPDSIGNITPGSQEEILDSIEDRKGILDTIRGKPGNNPTDSETPEDYTIGTDPVTTQEIADMAQEIADGLSCGFGGGGCMNFPINWAPLAPGNDPVIFGYPMGDGFRVDEGIPIFAGMTRFDWGFSPYCVTTPMIWPISPLKMEAARACSFSNVGEAWVEAGEAILAGGERLAEGIASSAQNLVTNGLQDTDNYQTADPANPASIIGAGGYIGLDSNQNFIRIYATPTLTLGVGVGICMGATARRFGGNPPPGLWPLSQVGNCIVVVDSLDMCKDDGSIADGDIRDVVGLGSVNPTWNAGNGSNAPGTTSAGGSCDIVAQTQDEIETLSLTQDIIAYTRSPDTARLPELYRGLSQKSPRMSNSTGPLLSLRGASADGALASVDIEIDLAKPLTADNIIKLKNKRIAGFPDFIMDWFTRQVDELIVNFFTVPSLVVIWPTSIGQNNQYDGTMSGLTDSFKTSYQQGSASSMLTKEGTAYDDQVRSKSASTGLQSSTRSTTVNADSDLGKWMQEQQNSFDSIQDSAFKGELGKLADKGKGGLSALRAAYKIIGKLPLITISERTVPVDVPWILPQELDRYTRTLDAYAQEINSTLSNNCIGVADQSACLNNRANTGPLLASINQNLKRLEEYKNFPINLQKYVTWKQRYLTQVLCYITEVQQMTTGWVKDNSIRFRKWVELWVLIRAIADSWQPLLDIVQNKDTYCSVCHNERYNAKYWKYKLISLLIPSLPVIKMPRWPDIVLDLSDVRLGIVIAVPNFQFNLKPIRLPNIPSLSLPTAPGVTLGAMDLIPPIPDLPDLPDLPSIPTIKLPNLPPPPKLPKILSELKVVLDILKLWKLLECYLNKTPFVPEWSVGDIIAQRTERQGTNPLDFIDINLPQISIPTIQEIRVSSHVNYEVRSDFITEFAKAAVAPLNEFTADLGRGIPKKVGENIDISSPSNITIDLQSSVPVGLTGAIALGIERLERDKDIMLDTDEFSAALIAELESNDELSHITKSLHEGMRMATVDADREERELLQFNENKYDLLREYVQLQYDETANMQHVIDLLTEEHDVLASVDVERALMVSENMQTRSSALAEKWNQGVLASLEVDDTVRASDTVEVEVKALQNRMKRLAANAGNDTSALAEVQAAIAPGYTPNFRGIYIVTESGTQTRLFDYTETLQEDNPSTRVDIDRDGDLDYLFLLDGALFLKRTTLTEPRKIIDTDRTIIELDENSPLPTAPNYFTEYVSLPNNINISYEAARAEETIWRTTFYDRYLEWDMVDLGEHDDSLSPQHILEVFSYDPDIVLYDKKVLRSLDRVSNPDSFVIEGPRMEVLTGSLEFILSPGRTLYTGDEAVTILYGTGVSEPTIEKRIAPHSGFAIPDIANVSFERGTLYIIYPSIVPQRYTYSDDLLGMPILPGMAISTGGGEVVLLDHVHDDDIVLPENALYHAESTIKLGNEYSIQREYDNGFYQARIENLDTRGAQVAGEALFTPQASSDSSAPDVDVRDVLDVPVYQEHSIVLRDIITDTNPYTLLVDTDVSQDTDNNGVYDDDFVASALGLSVTDTAVTFGPYSTIGNRYMMFKVTDEFYNTTYLPVTIKVYSPIPGITEYLGSGAVRGSVGDTLESQPVHLFRVRTGTDIFRLTGVPLMTNTGGIFTSPEYFTGSGAELTSSGQSVRISELGIPASLPSGYSTRVVLASASNPLSVIILDSAGRQLYRQLLTLPEDARFQTTGTGESVIVNTSNGYNSVSASVSDPSIPGGVYVTDSANRPLIAIARDGNIYPTASGVTTTFTQRDGYPQISLRIGETTFVDVLYKFDFFYTLK